MSQEELEQLRVALADTEAELEKARQTQSDFLGSISHELRTPLNAIVGLSEIALEQSSPEREVVESLHANALLLLSRVSTLLDYSKLDAGLMEILPRAADVREVIEDVVELHRARAEQRGLALELEISDGVPERVRVDPDRVRQIAENLVSNAVQHTHRGSVRVVLKPVASIDDRPTLELAVHDTGVGIPKREQTLVFTRFYRSYRSTSDQHQGTGLGLAMTKALVELMGGAMRLRSAPGEGSVFRARFPVETLDAPVDSPVVAARLSRRAQLLVADDSEANLTVVKGILEASGDHVTTVRDGHAALDAFASGVFDLVVMDVDMEPMDGLRATVEIRARESLLGLDRTPIVALTAHAVPEVRRRCTASGMDAFLTKPVDGPLLLRTLEGFLDRRPQVLVVDDALTSRVVVEKVLTSAGARVVQAADGQEALAAAEGARLDAAVLDHDLPDLTGPALAERLQARGFTGPVLAITGHGAAHAEAWAAVGVEDVFNKPLDLEGLIAKLGALLCPIVREIDPDIADLIPEYLENRRADVEVFRRAVADQDAKTIRKRAHQVKGSGTSYGYPDLTEAGGLLESAAEAEDWERIRALVNQIASIIA